MEKDTSIEATRKTSMDLASIHKRSKWTVSKHWAGIILMQILKGGELVTGILIPMKAKKDGYIRMTEGIYARAV